MSESRYFQNDATDRLLGVIMQLVGEVYVLKDRQAALERLLRKRGIDVDVEIDGIGAAMTPAERDAWVERILEPVVQAAEQPTEGARSLRVN